MRYPSQRSRLVVVAASLALTSGLGGCGLCDGSSGEPPSTIGKFGTTSDAARVLSIVSGTPINETLNIGNTPDRSQQKQIVTIKLKSIRPMVSIVTIGSFLGTHECRRCWRPVDLTAELAVTGMLLPLPFPAHG